MLIFDSPILDVEPLPMSLELNGVKIERSQAKVLAMAVDSPEDDIEAFELLSVTPQGCWFLQRYASELPEFVPLKPDQVCQWLKERM